MGSGSETGFDRASSAAPEDACLLCNAERLTTWHFEDEECWVADCMVCSTPMIVWRTHGLPEAEREHDLLARLERVAEDRYGAGRTRRCRTSNPGAVHAPLIHVQLSCLRARLRLHQFGYGIGRTLMLYATWIPPRVTDLSVSCRFWARS
jgi:hypothetical protein